MDLSIIIVNWNVKDLLAKCLESVFQHTSNISFEVIVIDNGSRDGSAEMVRQKFPQAKLVVSRDNLGFARANNIGIKRAQGRYILLLNPDSELFNNALPKMVELMDVNKHWAVAGCSILNPDKTVQPSVRRFPALKDQILILLKLHHLPYFRHIINQYLATDFNYKKTAPVDQIMGACFLIRRETIEKVGLLDEKFFYWFEEVDYCRRVKDVNLLVYYTPEAEIIHHGAASFNQLDWRKQLIWNHSLQRYFWKHSKKRDCLLLWLLQPVSVFLAFLVWIWKQ